MLLVSKLEDKEIFWKTFHRRISADKFKSISAIFRSNRKPTASSCTESIQYDLVWQYLTYYNLEISL